MDSEKALEKIGVGSMVIVAGFVLGAIFQYLIKVVLARFLGPDSYGVFVQGLALAEAAASIAIFGLQMSLPRFMSYYDGRGNKEEIANSVSTAHWMIIVSTVLASFILYLSAGRIATVIFKEAALVTPLKLFSLLIIPLGLVYFEISLFRGLQNASYKIYLDDIVFPGGVLALVLLFFSLGYGIEGAVYAYIIAAIATVLGGYYLVKELVEYDFSTFSGSSAKKLMFFSWPLFVISILLITTKWIDVLMIGWLMESKNVGIYNVAYSIAGITSFFLGSLSYMFMPVVSELHGKDLKSEIQQVFTGATRWIFTVVIPICAGMVIFPREIIGILFGASYTSGATVLAVLAIGFFYKAAKGPSGMILLAAGKTREQMLGVGLTAVFLVLLNLLLIPIYGILGAAVGTTAGFIIGDTVLLLLARREIGSFPYSRDFLRILAATAVSTISVYSIKIVTDPGLLQSVALGVFMLLLYGILLVVMGAIRDEDWILAEKILEDFIPDSSRIICVLRRFNSESI